MRCKIIAIIFSAGEWHRDGNVLTLVNGAGMQLFLAQGFNFSAGEWHRGLLLAPVKGGGFLLAPLKGAENYF